MSPKIHYLSSHFVGFVCHIIFFYCRPQDSKILFQSGMMIIVNKKLLETNQMPNENVIQFNRCQAIKVLRHLLYPLLFYFFCSGSL